MGKKILWLSIFLVFFGCQKETAEWNPIFEKTNFDYITESIERSLGFIDEAYSEAAKDRSQQIQEKLHQAKISLLEITDYYVPLTTIRQKIFDAERFYKLRDTTDSKQLLEESKAILAALDVKTTSESFDREVLTLDAMIDEIITTFNEGSQKNTYDKFRLLGKHINLMLYRGRLVLSGVEFDK